MTAPASIPESVATSRLTLRRGTAEQLRALIAGAEHFERTFGIRVEPGYCEFPESLKFSFAKLESAGDAAPWWSPCLVIHAADRTLIGLCGYKGPPTDGVVEIGYGIAPAYRGQGLATEAAGALVDQARRLVSLARIRAHTLPELNASAHVLIKCGFHKTGVITDPEDGVIWRWERTP